MNCPYCKAQTPIIWWGFRETRERGRIQRYKCQRCNRTFVENNGFFHKHKPEQTILSVLSQWWKGLTSRELADEHSICQPTVLRWLFEYIGLLYRFIARRVPRTTRKLHLDELFLKMRDTFYYVWDALCADSRFVFLFFSMFRDAESARQLLGQCPLTPDAVSDGAFSYPATIRERYGGTCKHHQCINFEDKKHNNAMERVQNTLRRFLHPRRGFHNLTTGGTQLIGWWLYYNYIRKHTAIGMTPAEKAGLIEPWREQKTVKQRIQWLIQQAIACWRFFTNRKCKQYRKTAPTAVF